MSINLEHQANTTTSQPEQTGLTIERTGEQLVTVWKQMLLQGSTPQLMSQLHYLSQKVIWTEEEIVARAEEALLDNNVEFKDAVFTAIIELIKDDN